MKTRKSKITLENLARMVAEGFEHTATKDDVVHLEERMSRLETGQEDIKLRLDNVAYRFELPIYRNA